MLRVKRNLEVYETLEDLVKDISRKVSPNVKLYNIQNLFFYFGGFFTLFSLMFIVDVFLFRLLRKIHRKLVRSLCTRTKFRTVAFWQNAGILFGTDKLRVGLNLARRVIIHCYRALKNVFVNYN